VELPKDHKEFNSSLDSERPPHQWSAPLQALWWDAKGNWEKAHECVDHLSSADSALVHAYLHRKEGDQWNATYWYRRADRKMPTNLLKEEFVEILNELLGC
jgi:hypothetical protein